MPSTDFTAAFEAAAMAGTTEAVTHEPPESGPAGSDVSPSTTCTLSTGMPVLSLTTCAKIVYVPVPISCVAQLTRAVPSLFSETDTCAAIRNAPQDAQAMPQPSIKSPSRIEPTAGLRFDHPNF